jgi:cysteine desulfuration protein SufE
MSENATGMPARLKEIVEDFQWAEGREKVEMLIYYSDKMPQIPPRLGGENGSGLDKVEECMTPVYVTAEVKDGRMYFYFQVPPESPTVRGFAAILSEGLSGESPDNILAVPDDFHRATGLDQVLTSMRANGLRSILGHMKQLAARELESRG